MPDDFIPLNVFLRAPALPDESHEDVVRVAAPSVPGEAEEAEPASELDEVFSDVRRFRAGLADALDVAVDTLLRDIAADVLARELLLAPVEIARIVERARERFAPEEPLFVRVHPDEAQALAGMPVATRSDERLRRGDVVIELRSGTIEMTLGTRLAALIST